MVRLTKEQACWDKRSLKFTEPWTRTCLRTERVLQSGQDRGSAYLKYCTVLYGRTKQDTDIRDEEVRCRGVEKVCYVLEGRKLGDTMKNASQLRHLEEMCLILLPCLSVIYVLVRERCHEVTERRTWSMKLKQRGMGSGQGGAATPHLEVLPMAWRRAVYFYTTCTIPQPIVQKLVVFPSLMVSTVQVTRLQLSPICHKFLVLFWLAIKVD